MKQRENPSHGCFCLGLSQSQAWGCGSVGQQEESALQHWGDLRLCALPVLGNGAAGLTNTGMTQLLRLPLYHTLKVVSLLAVILFSVL